MDAAKPPLANLDYESRTRRGPMPVRIPLWIIGGLLGVAFATIILPLLVIALLTMLNRPEPVAFWVGLLFASNVLFGLLGIVIGIGFQLRRYIRSRRSLRAHA